MMRWTNVAAVVTGALLLVSCGAAAPMDEVAAATPIGMWDITTSSPEARRQIEAGVAIMDMNGLTNNRWFPNSANEHFKRAVTEDPSAPYAYLLAAVTAPSLDEYRANLQQARELAATATEAERLEIEIEHRLFVGDLGEAAELARRLIHLAESNPRPWMMLAHIQSQSGQEGEARESARRAIGIEPAFTRGHLWLANSYLLFEPKDPAMAEGHVRRALELEPAQSAPYDLQGDLYRSHGRFDEAAAAYTRAAELDSTDAGVLLQRGHVYTFSGEYEKARADYDASSEREQADATLPLLYRALVSAYAGDPTASVAEYLELEGRIDRMGLPDPVGSKLGVLWNLATIAVGTDQLEAGRSAVERMGALMRTRAEQVGTDEFKRAREAEIAFWEGMLAIGAKDHAGARAKAGEIRELLRTDRNPAKDRPVHALLGLASLGEKSYEEALRHLEQADPNDEYLTFQRALALDGAGRSEEARAIYRTLATTNFNTSGLALVRRDALARSRQ